MYQAAFLIVSIAIGVGCGRIGYEPLQAFDAGTEPVLGPEVILDLGSSSHDNPMSIWESGKLVVGWNGGADDQALVASFDDQGTILDGPFTISGGARSDDCWLATNGTHFGAVWKEGPDIATSRVYFRLLLPTGEPFTAPVVLSARDTTVQDASIGWTGSRFVVAWRDTTSSILHRAIVSADGVVEEPDALFYPPGQTQADIELRSIAGTLYAVWRDTGAILRAEISSAGVLGAPEDLTGTTDTPKLPSIAGDASELALAYHDDPNGFHGVFVKFDGAPARLEVEPAPSQDSKDVAIAKGQGSYALIWDETEASGVEGFTEYAIVSPSGGLLAKAHLSENAHAASAHPSLVWTGEVFLAIWEYRVATKDELAFRRISPAALTAP